jgi:hypothetical protein
VDGPRAVRLGTVTDRILGRRIVTSRRILGRRIATSRRIVGNGIVGNRAGRPRPPRAFDDERTTRPFVTNPRSPR